MFFVCQSRYYWRLYVLSLASDGSDFASNAEAWLRTLTLPVPLYGVVAVAAEGLDDGVLAASRFCNLRRHSESRGVENTGSSAVCVIGALKDVGAAFCETLIVVKFGVNRLYADVGAL